MRRFLLPALLLSLSLAVASAAAAQDPSEERAPSDLAREGVERLMRALDAFIEMIPQYEMPELNENGDIIIRRKRDRGEEPSAEPEDDQTST